MPESEGKDRSQLIRPYRRRSEALDILFPKLFIEGAAGSGMPVATPNWVMVKPPSVLRQMYQMPSR